MRPEAEGLSAIRRVEWVTPRSFCMEDDCIRVPRGAQRMFWSENHRVSAREELRPFPESHRASIEPSQVGLSTIPSAANSDG